jgi:hypothetical protein
MKYIAKLSDKDLSRHIRVFLKHIPMHAQTLGITLEQIDAFGKQYQAFSWAVDVEEKLTTYSKDIHTLIRKLRSPISENISTRYFLDLPRPPVFVTRGDIQSAFRELVLSAKVSLNYSSMMGVDLGIEGLNS